MDVAGCFFSRGPASRLAESAPFSGLAFCSWCRRCWPPGPPSVKPQSMPVEAPANYGSIPRSLGHDGDPLDAVVQSRFPLHPGVFVRVRPVSGSAAAARKVIREALARYRAAGPPAPKGR